MSGRDDDDDYHINYSSENTQHITYTLICIYTKYMNTCYPLYTLLYRDRVIVCTANHCPWSINRERSKEVESRWVVILSLLGVCCHNIIIMIWKNYTKLPWWNNEMLHGPCSCLKLLQVNKYLWFEKDKEEEE